MTTDETTPGSEVEPVTAAEDQAVAQDNLADDELEPDHRLTKVRAEAKGLRQRLREAESERDELRAQTEQITARLDRTHRDSAAARATGPGLLRDGADLFVAGVTLEEIQDEDGNLDPEKIADAVSRVLVEHPGWAHRVMPVKQMGQHAPAVPLPDENAPKAAWAEYVGHLRSGASGGTSVTRRSSWADVLRQ